MAINFEPLFQIFFLTMNLRQSRNFYSRTAMKGWIVIHKIKSLYDNGNGLTERKIAKALGLSRNTVSKYLHMPETEVARQLDEIARAKKLDAYRAYIIQLLQTYPNLSAVKVMRKLKAKIDALTVSDRSMRRYIQALKDEISFKKPRYYEPVIDMVPGVQCQVDGGELRGVMIGGKETTVYFMVFVLSYSRLMHVSVSPQPIDTQTLIYQHDAAFRYFGGRPHECVYDQTKLVVINEIFRELELNQRFHQYATAAGFHIRACEGYDPESKGKVESGVKYVKHNGLYGETFKDWKSLETYLADWLDSVANKRVHGTTGQQPWAHYDREERVKMETYLTPSCLPNTAAAQETRQVDKTSLISWQSNKYSVPMAYQSAKVGVAAHAGQLLIHDLANGGLIAEHAISLEKGQIIKNTHHYRDRQQRVEALEAEIEQQLGGSAGQRLCALLKASSPKIYKDQLLGAQQVIATHTLDYGGISTDLLERILTAPRLTATQLRAMLEAYQQHPERLSAAPVDQPTPDSASALAHYAVLNGQSTGQGEHHVIH
jgi:transposase